MVLKQLLFKEGRLNRMVEKSAGIIVDITGPDQNKPQTSRPDRSAGLWFTFFVYNMLVLKSLVSKQFSCWNESLFGTICERLIVNCRW
jgi:hypothetical protein